MLYHVACLALISLCLAKNRPSRLVVMGFCSAALFTHAFAWTPTVHAYVFRAGISVFSTRGLVVVLCIAYNCCSLPKLPPNLLVSYVQYALLPTNPFLKEAKKRSRSMVCGHATLWCRTCSKGTSIATNFARAIEYLRH